MYFTKRKYCGLVFSQSEINKWKYHLCLQCDTSCCVLLLIWGQEVKCDTSVVVNGSTYYPHTSKSMFDQEELIHLYLLPSLGLTPFSRVYFIYVQSIKSLVMFE